MNKALDLMPRPKSFLIALGLLFVAMAAASQPTVVESPPDSILATIALSLVELAFALVPLSVILQIVAWRKLTGNRKRLARLSAYAMGALWVFVIVTAVAGSNLSPIWLVFLSPLFVFFLTGLLLAQWRSHRRADQAV